MWGAFDFVLESRFVGQHNFDAELKHYVQTLVGSGGLTALARPRAIGSANDLRQFKKRISI